MDKKRLISLFLALAMACSVLAAGCVREQAESPAPGTGSGGTGPEIFPQANTPSQAATPLPQEPAAKTCAAAGGDVCSAGEECPGTWLDAQDSFSCCSVPCTAEGIAGTVMTIDPYDTVTGTDTLESISV